MKTSRRWLAASAAAALLGAAGCHAPCGACHGGGGPLALHSPCGSSISLRLLAPRQEGLWDAYCLEPLAHGSARVCSSGNCASAKGHAPDGYSFPHSHQLLPVSPEGAAVEPAPPEFLEDEGFSAPSPPAAPMAPLTPGDAAPANPDEQLEPPSPAVDSGADEPPAAQNGGASSRRPQAEAPAPSPRVPAPVEPAPLPDEISTPPAPPTPPRNELPALEPGDFDEKTDSASRLQFLPRRKARFH